MCLVAYWQKLCHWQETDRIENKNASLAEAGILKNIFEAIILPDL